MLRALSIVSAAAWAGLAASAATAAPGNADGTLLYCVAAVAATVVASAVAIMIAPRTLFLVYCFVLSVIGGIIFLPYTILAFALCVENLPKTSAFDWLGALNFAVLVCLALLWPFQLRRHLHEVADKRLTTRSS